MVSNLLLFLTKKNCYTFSIEVFMPKFKCTSVRLAVKEKQTDRQTDRITHTQDDKTITLVADAGCKKFNHQGQFLFTSTIDPTYFDFE